MMCRALVVMGLLVACDSAPPRAGAPPRPRETAPVAAPEALDLASDHSPVAAPSSPAPAVAPPPGPSSPPPPRPPPSRPVIKHREAPSCEALVAYWQELVAGGQTTELDVYVRTLWSETVFDGCSEASRRAASSRGGRAMSRS